MATRSKNLAIIQYIIDTDTGMNQIGDIEGSLDEDELYKFIHRYGSDKLLSHLSFLIYQVVDAQRNVNNTMQRDCYEELGTHP